MRRAVPWSSSIEWKQIYYCLFSNSREEQQFAVNRIKAWTSRGKTPHAIESSANLIEVGLLENLSGEANGVSQRQLALLYGMALIRFVNGIIDGGQRGNLSSSAMNVAEQVGLPLWFVEVRHQATHDRMPALPHLRQCQAQALDWLNNNYWLVQIHALEDTLKAVESHLSEYANITQSSISKQDKAAKLQGQKIISDLLLILSIDTYPEMLFTLLIKQLTANSKKNSSILKVQEKWDPLLTSCELEWPGFSKNLWLAMYNNNIGGVGNVEDRKWCKFILGRFAARYQPVDLEDLAKEIFARKDLEMALHMRSTSGFPSTDKTGKYPSLLQYLEKCDYIENSELAEMPTGANYKPLVPNSEEIQQGLDELQARLDAVRNMSTLQELEVPIIIDEPMQQEEQDESGWTLVPEDGWTPCPIGSLPGSNDIPDLRLDPRYDSIAWLSKSGLLKIPIIREQGPVDSNKDQADILSASPPSAPQQPAVILI